VSFFPIVAYSVQLAVAGTSVGASDAQPLLVFSCPLTPTQAQKPNSNVDELQMDAIDGFHAIKSAREMLLERIIVEQVMFGEIKYQE